ncbi:hypothetical protein KIN20_030604 [Parelaphostrongylus tenuis]|nr:hypothetical protein KIN20_030604 [Parelaphostrongylus tenuis]
MFGAVERATASKEGCKTTLATQILLTDEHNALRRRYAKGNLRFLGLGGGTISDMNKLEYDCDLEQELRDGSFDPKLRSYSKTMSKIHAGERLVDRLKEAVSEDLFLDNIFEMLNSKQQRFGCVIEKEGPKAEQTLMLSCLYDTKNTDGVFNRDGRLCSECEYGRKCDDGLCAVVHDDAEIDFII